MVLEADESGYNDGEYEKRKEKRSAMPSPTALGAIYLTPPNFLT